MTLFSAAELATRGVLNLVGLGGEITRPGSKMTGIPLVFWDRIRSGLEFQQKVLFLTFRKN